MANQQFLNKPLTGKVAVITGSSSGIGKAIALRLAEAGASVVLGARRRERLQEVKETIEKNGGKAVAVETDVTVRQQVKDLVQKAETTFGPVDILVNNAGAYAFTLMKNVKEDEWERCIDVNCNVLDVRTDDGRLFHSFGADKEKHLSAADMRDLVACLGSPRRVVSSADRNPERALLYKVRLQGVCNGIGAVLPGMVARGKGHVVNISSGSGRIPFVGEGIYAGTKHFVEGMSKCLRLELEGTEVRVTSIQPGATDTDIFNNITDQEAVDLVDRKYPNYKNVKMLKPDDLARAVMYAVTQPPNVAVQEIMVNPTDMR